MPDRRPQPASPGALAAAAGVPLAELPSATRARLVASGLPALESQLLAAMGLALGCRLTVRAQGDPTIVEVRSTRIGLARSVAALLVVVVEATTP